MLPLNHMMMVIKSTNLYKPVQSLQWFGSYLACNISALTSSRLYFIMVTKRIKLDDPGAYHTTYKVFH
jgi:hypothetical protein